MLPCFVIARESLGVSLSDETTAGNKAHRSGRDRLRLGLLNDEAESRVVRYEEIGSLPRVHREALLSIPCHVVQ